MARAKHFDGLGSDDESKKMVASKLHDSVKRSPMFHAGLSLLIDSLSQGAKIIFFSKLQSSITGQKKEKYFLLGLNHNPNNFECNAFWNTHFTL